MLFLIPNSFLFISRHSRDAFSSVPGNGPDQAGRSQHTIHNGQHSFTFFHAFRFQFIVFFTTFATSPTATAHPRIVSIIFQFLFAKFVPFCRILFPAHHQLCQSCTISRVTRVPISTIVEIISTSLVCCFVNQELSPGDRESGKSYFR